ncbi:hypothetical protein D3C79_881040 [compost metagenome]
MGIEPHHDGIGVFSRYEGEGGDAGSTPSHRQDRALFFIKALLHGACKLQQASVARAFLDAGELVQILDSHTTATIPISVIYPPNKQLNSRVRVFIDWLIERLS